MCHKEINLTTYDKLLISWDNAKEMVRDFQTYANQIDDNSEVKQAFYDLAETSAQQAAQLRDLMLEYKKQ